METLFQLEADGRVFLPCRLRSAIEDVLSGPGYQGRIRSILCVT